VTLTLISTIGGATSNAYASEATITALLEGRPGSSAWTTASVPTREQAIVGATMRLEQESYAGYRASELQRLKWPRSGCYTDDGYLYSSAAMPTPLVQATAELALSLVVNPDLLDLSGLAQFESLSVGPISLTTRASALYANALPASVLSLLKGLSTSGPGMTKLVRG